MTGDSGGWDELPPQNRDNVRDNVRPPSSAPSANRSSMPPYGDQRDAGVAGDPGDPVGRGDAAPFSPASSTPGDPNATRKPVLRYVPGAPSAPGAPDAPGSSAIPGGAGWDAPGRPGTPSAPSAPGPQRSYPGSHPGSYPGRPPSGLDDRTQELPSGYFMRDMLGQRQIRPPRRTSSQGPLVLILSILIVVGVIGALLATPLRNLLSASSVPLIGGCADGSACQAASAYLADYGSGDYESMYKTTSSASRARFGAAATRGGYQDAHDYIVSRTKAILHEAQITATQTSVGETKSQNDTKATVNAQIVMTSARVGQITQSLAIPLIKENGKWMVDWTPGLIFAQLDDPSDPQYQRLVHLFTTTGARGAIFDRDGNALAKDDTVYDLYVDPKKIANETSLDNALATDLNMTPAQVKAAYSAGKPVRTISMEYYAKISGSLSALPGVYTQQRTARVYPYGADTAAVTGYVSGVTPDDLKNDTSHYYCTLDDASTCTASDVAGHTGVEAWGESYLRPQKGGTLAIVDRNADGSPSNQPLITIAARQATNGADVHTTISLKDQQAAMHTLTAFGKFDTGAGALTVDPVSGEVLVMASFPACDPNDFSLGFQPGVATCGQTAGAQINHAVASAQPIGSVFKVITLAAGLEHGVRPDDTFTCNGSYLVPGETKARADDSPQGHGTLTAPKALGPSCDVIYWQIAVRLNQSDPNALPSTAKEFGFGAPTGILGLADGVESAGVVPDPNWLKQNKNAGWTATDAANLGIGQGFFLATPAQVAEAAAAIANNGVRMQPLLVTSITAPDGTPVASYTPKQIGKLSLSADNLQVVQTAMLGPTQDPSGTAYRDFVGFPVLVAGKTGTAESGTQYPHGWFMSYAPASPVSGPPVQPKVAMGVVTEYMSYPSYAYGECYAVPTTLNVIRAQLNLPGQSGSFC